MYALYGYSDDPLDFQQSTFQEFEFIFDPEFANVNANFKPKPNNVCPISIEKLGGSDSHYFVSYFRPQQDRYRLFFGEMDLTTDPISIRENNHPDQLQSVLEKVDLNNQTAKYIASQLLDQAAWILGTWEMKRSKTSLFETWQATTNQEYSAINYRLDGTDTLISESIRMVMEGSDLFYIPTVFDQNDAQPVRFKATAVQADAITFENPNHDFPTKIEYRFLPPDSLIATVSGNRGNEIQQFQIKMKKIRE